jgi:hypothetical protein
VGRATRNGITATAFVLAFEKPALACPFCGGLDGDIGSLVNTLMVVAVFVFGTRALLRALRRRQAQASSEPKASSPARPGE